MKGVFPLWGRNTPELANQFIDAGFRAVICCVDPLKLSGEFCGREYDTDFLDSIPSSVDPCGENGEFHTFVYAGPIFRDRIRIVKGEVVLREGFYFADILPGAGLHL
jgi:diphthamide synthase (EF-2-diphthine--ammonia ligase)